MKFKNRTEALRYIRSHVSSFQQRLRAVQSRYWSCGFLAGQ